MSVRCGNGGRFGARPRARRDRSLFVSLGLWSEDRWRQPAQPALNDGNLVLPLRRVNGVLPVGVGRGGGGRGPTSTSSLGRCRAGEVAPPSSYLRCDTYFMSVGSESQWIRGLLWNGVALACTRFERAEAQDRQRRTPETRVTG